MDGDGLMPPYDPDDSKADTDSDGVPDAFELQIGTNPRVADTDGDGLGFYRIAVGTDPLRRDSDNDGVSDGDEVAGRLFTYNTGKQSRIYSDPLNADSDGDGFGDGAEAILGLNARAADPNPLNFGLSIDDADAILKPAATFVFTATLTNALQPGAYGRANQIYAAGWETNTLPSGIAPSPSGSQTSFSQQFTLAGSTITRTLNLRIVDNSTSGPRSLLNTAAANLYDGVPASNNLIGQLRSRRRNSLRLITTSRPPLQPVRNIFSRGRHLRLAGLPLTQHRI